MNRTIEIIFPQDSRGAIALMCRLFSEGWETLEPTRYCKHCCLYYTTLYLPLDG
jgi:hypothetical protein